MIPALVACDLELGIPLGEKKYFAISSLDKV